MWKPRHSAPAATMRRTSAARPRRIDSERLGAAAHPHPRALDLELGIDPDREPRRLAGALGGRERALGLALGFEVEGHPGGDRLPKLGVALAGPGEADVAGRGAGLEREPAARRPRRCRGRPPAWQSVKAAGYKSLLLWRNATARRERRRGSGRSGARPGQGRRRTAACPRASPASASARQPPISSMPSASAAYPAGMAPIGLLMPSARSSAPPGRACRSGFAAARRARR